MKKEEKQLLLKDLCGRLPHGVKANIRYCDLQGDEKIKYRDIDITYFNIEQVVNNWLECKPYLRPLESMTDEEKTKIASMSNFNSLTKSAEFVECSYPIVDYCCSRYLDYHGLIGMGLALEAPEGMYKTE